MARSKALVSGSKALHVDSLGGRTGVTVVRVIRGGTVAVVRGAGVEWTAALTTLEAL